MFAFASPASAATLKGTCRDAGGTADATVSVSVGKKVERTVVNGIRTKRTYSVVRSIRVTKVRALNRSQKVVAKGAVAQVGAVEGSPFKGGLVVGQQFTPGTVITVTPTWEIAGSFGPKWCDIRATL